MVASRGGGVDEIIDEMTVRVGKTRTLRRTLDAPGLDAMANNLRGLTEEEARDAGHDVVIYESRFRPMKLTTPTVTVCS